MFLKGYRFLKHVYENLLRKLKKKYYTEKVKRQVKSFKGKIVANNFTYLNSNTILGDNINFNGLIIAGNGNVNIGNNFHSGIDCYFITSFHNYDNGLKIPYDETYIDKDIIIKDNVWLGSKVLILGGVTIEEGAIIQAGSVVTKSIPYCAIVGGAPAQVFKYRDIKHYEQLKSENKYH